MDAARTARIVLAHPRSGVAAELSALLGQPVQHHALAADALAVLPQRPLDGLLVGDVEDMAPAHVVRVARRLEGGATLPVVLLLDRVDGAAAAQFRHAGGSGALRWPAEAGRLAHALRRDATTAERWGHDLRGSLPPEPVTPRAIPKPQPSAWTAPGAAVPPGYHTRPTLRPVLELSRPVTTDAWDLSTGAFPALPGQPTALLRVGRREWSAVVEAASIDQLTLRCLGEPPPADQPCRIAIRQGKARVRVIGRIAGVDAAQGGPRVQVAITLCPDTAGLQDVVAAIPR